MKSGCMGITSLGYGGTPTNRSGRLVQNLSVRRPAHQMVWWLRTGDLGVIFDGELFIMGRIKDLLVVDGSNHYPDDVEATIQEITGGRVVAIVCRMNALSSLSPSSNSRSGATRTRKHWISSVPSNVRSHRIAKAHRVRISDLVPVAPGSIPITTSGKVRRSACVERYLQHQFTRLDVPA